MSDWLDQYRAIIEQQPTCEEAWFQDRWRLCQAGDEMAAREISGSCLRFALQIAQARAADFPQYHLLDVVEEANAGLMNAVQSFRGGNKDDFVRFAEVCIQQRLGTLA